MRLRRDKKEQEPKKDPEEVAVPGVDEDGNVVLERAEYDRLKECEGKSATYYDQLLRLKADHEKAFKEFRRVLSDSGTLVFSELLLDPDYPLAASLERLADDAGFRLQRKVGNFFYYTLIFEKANIG